MKRQIEVRVGQSDGDLVGRTNKVLQAAVDYVGGLGGGVVHIGPGEYLMEDSLHLRDGVTVRGDGDKTVLRKSDAVASPLATDGDYGEEQFSVKDPTGFAVGGGVTIGPPNPGNFHTTVARITGQLDECTFTIDRPLVDDYIEARGALAQTTFPVISGYYVTGAVVEDLTIDGNREANPSLGGCRGGGLFLYRSHGAQFRRVTVRDYNGDGISYQQSHDVLVEDCVVENCTDKGIHPGSGSQRTTVRRCRFERNEKIGLFLCWRVRHSVFESNEIYDNGVVGISIGHKDTDNLFRDNTVKGNRRYGVLFRNETAALAGHRNRFEGNRILDNGRGDEGYGFYIGGETEDVEIAGNTIGNTSPAEGSPRQKIGVWVGAKAKGTRIAENEFAGHAEDVHYEEPA